MFYRSWKFTVLLVAMVVLLAIRQATYNLVESQVLIDLCGAAAIVAAALSIGVEKPLRTAAVILVVPAIFFTLIGHALPNAATRSVFLAGRAASAALLGFTVLLIMKSLLTERRVSRDTISGAFCGYLLIAIAWTEIYCMVALVTPDAFAGEAAADGALSHVFKRWHILQYFSFVTLINAAYGNLTPSSGLARALACIETICGQFYLAVLVAGLVGIRAARLTAERESELDERPQQLAGAVSPRPGMR